MKNLFNAMPWDQPVNQTWEDYLENFTRTQKHMQDLCIGYNQNVTDLALSTWENYARLFKMVPENRYKELNREYEQSIERVTVLKKQVSTLEKETKDTQKQCTGLEKERKTLKAIIADQKKEIAARKQELETQVKNVDKQEKRITDQETMIAAQKKEISEYKNKIAKQPSAS